MKDLSKDVHDKIVHFIDTKISGIDDGTLRKVIFHCSEMTNDDYVFVGGKAKFYADSPRIFIHRVINHIPNESFLDEVMSILHEYGHHISLFKGKYPDITEVGYSYNVEEIVQGELTILEEVNAWRYAIITIWELPISELDKMIICSSMFHRASTDLYSYKIGFNGSVV